MLKSVAKKSELKEGSGIKVQVGEKIIALFMVEEKVFALDDACSHRGASLSEGAVMGTAVRCPWHGAKFDLATGKVLNLPASRPVACYPVKLEGDDIQVEIP